MIFSTGSIEQFHGSFKYLESRTSHNRNNNRYVEIIYQNDPEINLRSDLFSDLFYLDARSRDVQNTERQRQRQRVQEVKTGTIPFFTYISQTNDRSDLGLVSFDSKFKFTSETDFSRFLAPPKLRF